MKKTRRGRKTQTQIKNLYGCKVKGVLRRESLNGFSQVLVVVYLILVSFVDFFPQNNTNTTLHHSQTVTENLMLPKDTRNLRRQWESWKIYMFFQLNGVEKGKENFAPKFSSLGTVKTPKPPRNSEVVAFPILQ